MQRFKKELNGVLKGNKWAEEIAKEHGKFAYRSNGSVCQMGRWREDIVAYLDCARWCIEQGRKEEAHSWLYNARKSRQASAGVWEGI